MPVRFVRLYLGIMFLLFLLIPVPYEGAGMQPTGLYPIIVRLLIFFALLLGYSFSGEFGLGGIPQFFSGMGYILFLLALPILGVLNIMLFRKHNRALMYLYRVLLLVYLIYPFIMEDGLELFDNRVHIVGIVIALAIELFIITYPWWKNEPEVESESLSIDN